MIIKPHPEGVAVTQKSPHTKKDNTVVMKVPLGTFEKSLYKWQANTPIQEAFPYLNADDREFLKTGLSPDDWEDIFG